MQKAAFLSLDDPNYRRLLMEDPLHYLNDPPKLITLDEVQYLKIKDAENIYIIYQSALGAGQCFLDGHFLQPPGFLPPLAAL